MTIFDSFMFGIIAVLIIMNLALLVAAVLWAMGRLPGFPLGHQPAKAQATVRKSKSALHSCGR